MWNAGYRDSQLSSLHETFGLITRVFDPSTGHPIVMTSGLILGTRAAGECLIDVSCLDQARRLAPGDWRQRNVQVVVATKVIGEKPGAPHRRRAPLVARRHRW